MTAIDLFSGGGGFHEAATQNGISVVFASEIDKFAAHNYQVNYGLKPHGDITKIPAEDIPPHGLLMAGFPCQAFSIAGKRRGLDDARGTLFYEVARILAHHSPRFALLENVKGLLSHHSLIDGKRVRTMDIIHNIITSLGYWVHAKVLNSKDFGVPQNRERIFLACFRQKEDFHKFRWPSGFPLDTVLRDLLEDEIPKKYYVSDKMIPYIESRCPRFLSINPDISPSLMAMYGKMNSGAYVSLPYTKKELDLKYLLNGRNTQGFRIYGTDGIACCLSANGGGFGTKTGLYDVSPKLEQTILKEAAANRAGIDEEISRTITTQGGTNGRGTFVSTLNLVAGKNGEKASQRVYSDDGICPTLTSVLPKIANDGERRIRRLTPRECARLQGFPDSYKIDVSDSQAYKIFGNAVTVNVVSAILKKISEL